MFSVETKLLLEHSWELIGMRVLCETEAKVIAEIIKETQYFYMENHLWPNGDVKTTTYLSRISTNTFVNTGQVRYTM